MRVGNTYATALDGPLVKGNGYARPAKLRW